MNEKTVLILERSSQNLQKINKGGKTVLEGVFAEFGKENRNGRIYEESQYLPHLEYLKKDIANNSLLGELDHPERFEVSLGNVSHRITELWYDQAARQVKGRIEILEGTPKGQIAKSLLEAGIPLSISSRAAGSVNDDKSVDIQQIYTYDLVAKPGFEQAQLRTVNESLDPNMARIKLLVESMNNSFDSHKKESMATELGIVNENISVYDVTDKFPAAKLREEAKAIMSKNKNNDMSIQGPEPLNEDAVQEWTVYFKNELIKLNERLDTIETLSTPANVSKEIKEIRGYIEKTRKLQEGAINWQTDMAKAINKVGNYANAIAKKGNEHYDLTKKIVETVDYNAKTLNHTQDWVGKNAEVTNLMAETADHNANMLNHINEWTGQIAKGVNALNEWGTEKAVAINGMHEWASDIAKNLNYTATYTEEMLGRAMSKADADKLIKYVELVAESKSNPKLKSKINEMLKTNSINLKPLSENTIKGMKVIDSVGKVGNVKVGDIKGTSSVIIDAKTKTIIAKTGSINFTKGKKPAKLKTTDCCVPRAGVTKAPLNATGTPSTMKVMDKTKTIPVAQPVTKAAPSTAAQNLKLNVKPESKLKESIDVVSSINLRSNSLNEKLSKIIEISEKQRATNEQTTSEYPFVKLLAESDKKRFVELSATDKQKVADRISKTPTVESDSILKLWENALAKTSAPTEPKWLELAPKQFKDAFNKASMQLKESLTAKSEFFTLDTQYQINNFWETSGLTSRPASSINESKVIIGQPSKETDDLDPMIANIALAMNRYNQYR
jgi:hypothetical protein